MPKSTWKQCGEARGDNLRRRAEPAGKKNWHESVSSRILVRVSRHGRKKRAGSWIRRSGKHGHRNLAQAIYELELLSVGIVTPRPPHLLGAELIELGPSAGELSLNVRHFFSLSGPACPSIGLEFLVLLFFQCSTFIRAHRFTKAAAKMRDNVVD